jgi:hypothetical protein
MKRVLICDSSVFESSDCGDRSLAKARYKGIGMSSVSLSDREAYAVVTIYYRRLT